MTSRPSLVVPSIIIDLQGPDENEDSVHNSRDAAKPERPGQAKAKGPVRPKTPARTVYNSRTNKTPPKTFNNRGSGGSGGSGNKRVAAKGSTATSRQSSTLSIPGNRNTKASITIRSSSPAFRGLIKQGSHLSEALQNKEVIVKKEDESSSSTTSEEEIQNTLEALRHITDVEYLFMQRLLDYQDIEAAGVTFREDNPVDLAYRIVNNEGETLFLMEQHRIIWSSFIIYTRRSFQNTLYNVSGHKVMKIAGPSVFMSRMMSRVTVTDAHGRLLGYIKSFGSKVNYSVYNAMGERLFLVVSKRYLPTPKTIFSILHRGHKIGEIRAGWNVTFPDLDFLDSHDTGIHFPIEMDEREKALVLGCMMLIEFSWYSPLTKLKLFFVFAGMFLSLFTVIMICVPIIVDKHKESNETRSYFYAKDDIT